MSRKALTLVAMLLVAAVGGAATPVAAASGSSTFDAATLERGGVLSFNTTDSVSHFGEPSWLVAYDDGELTSLQSWADADQDRRIVETYNDSNRALVAAPPKAMGARALDRWLGNGLSSRSYVESIRLNTVLSNVEPVTLRNASALEAPTAGILAAEYRAEGGYSPEGIAFKSDAVATTLQEARNMTGADEVNADTTGITVAVVDTGVNTAGGQVFGNGSRGSELRVANASKDFIDDETVNESGVDAVADPAGHGTHVASTIAADYNGTEHDGYAPNATILALRALDAEGSGSSADIAAAIRYAAAQDADVISLSLGSPTYSAEIVEAIENATEQGSVVVVAAGNSRQTTRWLATPADAPVDGVVSVAATNHSVNASNAAVGYFSQLGDDPGTTDFSEGDTAGEDITVSSVGMKLTAKTPDESGSVSSTTLTGTSMAAPTVSGGIAQALAANPSWQDDPATVAEKVETTARPLPKATTQETGAGLLAVDNLATDTQPEEGQSDAMTETAQERETFWTWLSDSSGGWLAGWS
jgi:subtilisin family serine protease